MGQSLIRRHVAAGRLASIAHRRQRGNGRSVMMLVQRADAGRRRFFAHFERHHDRRLRQTQAVIGEHHKVAVGAVFEVVVNAFLFAEPIEQRQIAFFVLDAKWPERVMADRHVDPVILSGQGVFNK